MLNEDARALSTLINMHWRNGRWRRRGAEPFDASPVDIAHATAAGYLFPSRQVTHDNLVEETTLLASVLSLEDASQSFVASLSQRRLFLRPFLPSLVVARKLPAHEFVPGKYSGVFCSTCGLREHTVIERDVLNFERHKWGGVRHLDLAFVWFSLDRFAAEGGAEPAAADHELLDATLRALRGLAPGTSATKAEPALRMLKSNKPERFIIIESLSIASVLEHETHPGFLNDFVRFDDRDLPVRRYAERGYPAEWWTSDCGVNMEAVRGLFPESHQ